MQDTDLLHTLRALYDQWTHLKAAVVAWVQTWAWLGELAVVAWFLGALILLALLWGGIGLAKMGEHWRAWYAAVGEHQLARWPRLRRGGDIVLWVLVLGVWVWAFSVIRRNFGR